MENKSCSSYDFKKNNVDWYLTNSKFEDGSCAKFCPLSVEMFAVTFLRTDRNGADLKFVATVVSNCVNFTRKQRLSLQNLRRNMKFTHIFGKFTHTFSKTIEIYILLHFIFNKKRTKIINADIYAVLLLAKKVTIYAFLLCKLFGSKIRSCKIFDKFHVCFPNVKM